MRIDALRAVGNATGVAGMKKLIPTLADRLKNDPDFEVRITIADELGALGPEGKEAVPALRQAQADPQVKVREAATAAVRKIERKVEKPKDKPEDKKP